MTEELPLPTDIQYENFAQHICWAHSWYKHIPLFEGAEFIFFLSEHAGGDFCASEPRLHYAWKTTEEYRQRFGYLDYAYRLNDREYFYRDCSDNLLTRPENLDSCSIILYPFVSTDFNAQDTLHYLCQSEYLDRLSLINTDPSSESYHPNCAELIAWFDEYQKYTDMCNAMSEDDRHLSVERSLEDDFNILEIDNYHLSTDVVKYLKQEALVDRIYHELQSIELAKIHKALMNLVRLISQGIHPWY